LDHDRDGSPSKKSETTVRAVSAEFLYDLRQNVGRDQSGDPTRMDSIGKKQDRWDEIRTNWSRAAFSQKQPSFAVIDIFVYHEPTLGLSGCGG
jgi:hypothetical protein